MKVLCAFQRPDIANTMATAGDDFEKGDANGAHASLALAAHVAQLLGASNAPGHVPAK